MSVMFRAVSVLILGLTSFMANAEITVENAWIRLLPPVVKTTAAYMEIVSSEDDVLLSVSSSVATMSELHESSMSNGVMSMNQVQEIVLPKNERVFLKSGGYHIMLMMLRETMKEGEVYPLMLEFKHAGKLQIDVPVKKQ